jgi:hypothetical protein
MPKSKAQIRILAATDPENISIRLCSWDPMPDYLYSTMAKDFSSEDAINAHVVPAEGVICAAKLENGWERVSLVRPSKTMGNRGYWVVYALDVGMFSVVHEKKLQPLSSSVCVFDKILLAKCRVKLFRITLYK